MHLNTPGGGNVAPVNEAQREPLHVPAGADWREKPKPMVPEENVLGFCGFLTAELPELHGIHPQRVADAWERFKVRVANGEWNAFFAADGEG